MRISEVTSANPLVVKIRKSIPSLTSLALSSRDLIFCAIIVLFGAVLRLHEYSIVPIQFWTRDEYAFAWSGMSLIKNHVPTAWSYLRSYGQVPFVDGLGTRWRLVTPWLDHPPLFSLIVGAAALLAGARSFFDVTLASIRVPALLFGIGSIPLVYVLSRRLYNTSVAVIASLIFATSPALVYLSRLAVSESLVVFLSLSMMVLLLKYLQSSNQFYFYLAAFSAGLASLAKMTGIFLVPLLCLLLAHQRKWRESIVALIIGILIFSTYLGYGTLIDFKGFISILQAQAARFRDILIFDHMLFYTGMPFFDAWFAFGFLALFSTLISSHEKTQNAFVSFPIIIYILVLLFSGSQSHFWPWYVVPMYPFISIAIANFFYRLMKRPEIASACLIIFFIGTWCLRYAASSYWGNLDSFAGSSYKYAIVALISAGLAPFVLRSIVTSDWTRIPAMVAAVSFFVLAIAANAFIVYRFPVTLTGKVTKLSVSNERWSLEYDNRLIEEWIEGKSWPP